MKLINNFIFTIIILYISIYICSGQTNYLDQDEYNCAKALYTTTLTSSIDRNSSGLYDFCKTGSSSFTITCLNNHVSSIVIYQQTQNPITNEFLCFPYLVNVRIVGTVADLTQVLGNPYQSQGMAFSLSFSSGTGITLPKVHSSISKLTILITQQLTPLVIKFSQLSGLTEFLLNYVNDYPSSNSFSISFENDLIQEWRVLSFRAFSNNFPSFNLVSVDSFYFVLTEGFDKASLQQNINTISLISIFVIYASPNEKVPFPANINSVKTNFTSFKSYIAFEAPSQYIDISNLYGNQIYFYLIGRDFHLNGKMPLININQNINSFYYNDGYISQLDLSIFSKLQTLSLANNSISSTMGILDSSSTIKYLDLSNNNLYGSIDESYCKALLIVNNNALTNDLPSCFSCFLNFHYLDTTKKSSNFANNSFTTDINNPPECTTIVPYKIVRSDPNFLLYGEDLGYRFISAEFKVYDSSNNLVKVSSYIDQVPNYQLIIKLNQDLDINSRYFILEYKILNQNYTVSWNPLKPQINKVTWTSSELIFDGSYFNYNISAISISIDNINCNIVSATFYQITCSISGYDPNKANLLTIVKVDNLSTQITLNPNDINVVINCTENYQDCNFDSNNGYCNTKTGLCECYSDWQSSDCSVPFIQCPAGPNLEICSGSGSCLNTTGECICNKDQNGWTGSTCSIPTQYISSITPSSTDGGTAIFYGWFGDIHDGLTVLIGDKDCAVSLKSSEMIVCNAPPGEGLKSVNLTQNSISYYRDNIYKYESVVKSCPNCVHGYCNTKTGYCVCENKWSGQNCALSDYDGTETNVTDGETSINDKEINFELSILYLLEISIDGSLVSNYTLQNEWKAIQSNNSNIYKFNQTLDDNNNSIESTMILYTIEHVRNDKNFTFANIEYLVKANSIKISVEISNYQYQSNLNTLQLVFKSKADTQNLKDECKENNVDIKTNGEDQNLVSHLNIQVNDKLLYGRFLNYMISNNKTTAITSSILSTNSDSILIGINMAHCSSCILDPDFGVVLDPNFNSNKCNNRKWLIPVAVVVPVVGLSVLIIVIIVIYKKSTSIKVLIKGTKLKKLNK